MLKSIEHSVRRLFTTLVGKATTPVVVDKPIRVMSLEGQPSIVVLRQDRIGDLLITIPLIRSLRAAIPNAHITVVLGKNNQGVAQAVEPWVNTTVVYRKSVRSLLSLRRFFKRHKAYVAIDMMDNPSATSSLLLWLTGAPYRIGIDKANRGAYTHVVPLLDRASVHIVDRIAMLTLPFGFEIPVNNRLLEYRIRDAEVSVAKQRLDRVNANTPLLFVNLSGSDETRMYPEKAIVEVLLQLKSDLAAWDVVIACAPHHVELQGAVCQQTGCRAAPVVHTFHDYAALVAQASLVLTPDTSTVHVAAGRGIPAVVLYVHDNPMLLPWTPYKTAHVAVVSNTRISDIQPQDVVQAVRSMLESTESHLPIS